MFHKLPQDKITKLPQKFTCPFCYQPNEMAVAASNIVREYISTRMDWAEELQRGKMFGVLIVENQDNEIGFLAAYSGNINGENNHSYFVPPIYDCQVADGYFKREESAISLINKEINKSEQSEDFIKLQKELAEIIEQSDKEINAKREIYRQNKRQRETERAQGISSEREKEMISASQYEKAEIKRAERRWADIVSGKKSQIAEIEAKISQMKEMRKKRSEALQEWLFEQYIVENYRGEYRSVGRIFQEVRGQMPPGGTGECCAPKLLHEAYKKQYRPIAMAEFWVGESPNGEIRHSGEFYPACHSKCEPILNFMLEGLDVEENAIQRPIEKDIKVLYEDDELLIVNKPEGLLSVKGKENSDSLYSRLKMKNPNRDFFVVHRLDMATSGVLILAKDKETYKAMQRQFEMRQIKKRYVAILSGIVENDSGMIDLPMRLNPDDRPRQVIDFQNGKKAITNYRVIERDYKANETKVEFYPQTGRTHQLRVHSAYSKGLNCPIKGDNLYGTPSNRLYLHAEMLQFVHPTTKEEIKIEEKADF